MFNVSFVFIFALGIIFDLLMFSFLHLFFSVPSLVWSLYQNIFGTLPARLVVLKHDQRAVRLLAL